MKVDTIEISWHAKKPIFSLDVGPSGTLATAGADNIIRIWDISASDGSITYLSSLDRHTLTVNVVRFSTICTALQHEVLASGSDDQSVVIWSKRNNDTSSSSSPKSAGQAPSTIDCDHSDDKETWDAVSTLRGHQSDVTSISWASDSKRLISGEIDHRIIVWDLTKRTMLQQFTDHSKFIKGVAWDPLNEFIVSQSCDRSLKIYRETVVSGKPQFVLDSTVTKSRNGIPTPQTLSEGTTPPTPIPLSSLFADDSVVSYFRRLCWSPDGTFLVAPTGIFNGQPCTWIMHRLGLDKPLYCLTGGDSPTVGVAFNPKYFLRRQQTIDNKGVLPEYRMVFAVASISGVAVYDTEQSYPLTYCKGIHYSQITDLAWSFDGLRLYISSTDGFVSRIRFEQDELGKMLSREEIDKFGLRLKEAAVELLQPVASVRSVVSSKTSPHSVAVKRIVPVQVAPQAAQAPQTPSPRRIVPELIEGQAEPATSQQPRRVPLIHFGN